MKLKLPTACVLLSLSVAGLLPLAGFIAQRRSGPDGLRAVLLAAGICWFAASAALMVTGCLRNSPYATAGILVATGLRLGLPLASGLALQHHGGELAEAGVFGWIVVFYLLTLAIETTLCVMLDRSESMDGRGKPNNG